jgi:hypothetical protein
MDTNVAVRLQSEEWCAGYARCLDKVTAWLDAEAARCCDRADATRGITAGDLRQAALCYSPSCSALAASIRAP